MIKTAGGTATNHVTRLGYGDYPSNAGDWSVFLRFKYPSTPTGSTYASLFNLFDGAADFSDPYFHIGSDVDTSNIGVDIFVDGSHEFQSSFTTITNTAQNWVAVSYNATTHLASFYVNSSTLADSGTINLSAITWDKLYLLGDAFAGGQAACSVAYCRAWSSLLTGANFVAEAASSAAVITTELLWDCPLQASVDLTAHNNTLNFLKGVGTVTTDTTDPLLSVVAAPPANTTPATATTLTYDSAYFVDLLSSGVAAPTSWYKVTAQDGDKVFGAIAFGTLGVLTPTIKPYEGLVNANADDELLGIASNSNSAIQIPVTAGLDYYFKVSCNAVTPATVIVSILRGLTIDVADGDIAISDVTDGFPLAVLDGVATGYPKNWVLGFPVGEAVGVLSDGRTLNEDTAGRGTKLFNKQFMLLATPTAGTRFEIAGSNDSSFAIGKRFGGVQQFQLATAAGVVDPTVYDLVSGDLRGITLSPDGDIAYVTGSTQRKFIIASSTISTFVSNETGFGVILDPWGLPDGTVLIGWRNGNVANKVLRYNADGTTNQTYTLGATDNIEHLAKDPDRLVAFWVWAQPSDQFSRFLKIDLTTGSTLIDLPNVNKYNDGVYRGSATNTPVRFGHSFSCTFWILQEGVIPPVPTETVFTIRRERRWLLPSSPDNKTMQIPTVEILMRTGIGLTPTDAWDGVAPQGVDPQVMWSWSKDGGMTWQPERWISASRIGKYMQRVRVLRATGQYRNAVGRIVVTDPVDWQMLAALAPNGVIEGTS